MRRGFVVLRRPRTPAVLVEAGFINSDTDNQLFDDNFDDIALAIAEGILDTLQMNGLIENNMDSENMENPPGSSTGNGNPGNNPEHSEGSPQYTVQAGAFRNGGLLCVHPPQLLSN